MRNEKKKSKTPTVGQPPKPLYFKVTDNKAGDIARVLAEINESHERLGVAAPARITIIKQALTLYSNHLKI